MGGEGGGRVYVAGGREVQDAFFRGLLRVCDAGRRYRE